MIDGWQRWFAWHPVRVPVANALDGRRWVWLRYVERRMYLAHFSMEWEYRL